uniref:Uncharacterized protein n=1 Tax=Chromera velia CCMP2878 TaxID=1169474 RepID=A0A0G4F7V1_9ALVE|eukprot:Cvel_2941.t1-p1 / transcript=Cvel_2941.t1 / gene=Cvel_2941 / organism=Chromera_velia_CCMP2878 / gene_product=hypothetical protein / transcript_product=hypothetical protein / location=Cvel_scaffold116:55374-60209(+) / protein_length=148 / sequence_SO=supercontig / SO=protein_coding / is_pseudo=false
MTNREAGSEGLATKLIKEFQTYIGNRGGRSDEEELDALLDDIGIEGLGEREASSESPTASALSVSAPGAPTLATREEYNTCFDLLGGGLNEVKLLKSPEQHQATSPPSALATSKVFGLSTQGQRQSLGSDSKEISERGFQAAWDARGR